MFQVPEAELAGVSAHDERAVGASSGSADPTTPSTTDTTTQRNDDSTTTTTTTTADFASPPLATTSEQSLSDSILPTLANLDIASQLAPIAPSTGSDSVVDAVTDPSSSSGAATHVTNNDESSSIASIDKPETSSGSSSHMNEGSQHSDGATAAPAAAHSTSQQNSFTTIPSSTSATSTPDSAPSDDLSSATTASLPAATVAAIKSRDFAQAPPPQRPAPTVLGQHLSNSQDTTGYKSVSSAPAVQTLSSTSTSTTPSSSSSSSSSSSLSTTASLSPTASGQPSPSSSTPSTGTTTPVPLSSGRPTPTSRPSNTVGGGASSVRRTGSGAGLAARIPPSLQAKMAAMASRSNNPTSISLSQNTHLGPNERISTSQLFNSNSSNNNNNNNANRTANGTGQQGAGPSGSNPGLHPALGMGGRPSMGSGASAPGRVSAMGPVAGRVSSGGPMAGAGGLGKRRGPGAGLTLAGLNGGSTSTGGGSGGGGDSMSSSRPNGPAGRNGRPQMRLPGGINGVNSSGGNATSPGAGAGGTPFANFSKIVDPSGSLNFQNKAVINAKGVNFSNGSSFKINMDELELQDELGAGNYGTVRKVYHKVTGVTMAMKEIRLELDDSKLKAIITELDILHRAVAPEIVDFYGAFFIESCVYYCMEFMDASLDKLAGAIVTEPVLKRVTGSIVRGLKFLKDELQMMHRDVKPTNVLVNVAGSVKLCDFGVSGQLERSLAKTNIGCQSYMAPERIKGESLNFLGTYTVSSDVWSLGLSIIEFTLGHYPYPPETYSNVFAQLQAIVHGDPPGLPDGYSKEADDFVACCLHKDANKRPTYAQLLQHPFLADEPTMDVDMAGWVKNALALKKTEKEAAALQHRSSSSSSASSSASSTRTLG